MSSLHVSHHAVDLVEKIAMGGFASAVAFISLVTAGILVYMWVLN